MHLGSVFHANGDNILRNKIKYSVFGKTWILTNREFVTHGFKKDTFGQTWTIIDNTDLVFYRTREDSA